MITPAGVVSTLAGSAGNEGSSDGTGTAAQFDGPAGVVVDSAGNVFVADTYNYTIRKITPTVIGGATNWVVTTLAGVARAWGSSDGTGSSAQFADPMGIVLDGANNLYVTDDANDTIRRITPDGSVTTIAGSAGKQDSTDGSGSAARFYYPMGIVEDSTGDFYVADSGNGTIRKITPTVTGGVTNWVVTTVAGSAAIMARLTARAAPRSSLIPRRDNRQRRQSLCHGRHDEYDPQSDTRRRCHHLRRLRSQPRRGRWQGQRSTV